MRVTRWERSLLIDRYLWRLEIGTVAVAACLCLVLLWQLGPFGLCALQQLV